MDFFALLLAALAGPITQQSRLLRLHTPLGPDVLLAERVTVLEAVGPYAQSYAQSSEAENSQALTGFRLEVQALCIDTHLELKTLVGQPVLLELLTQASRIALRPFHGHVTQFALMGSDGGLARYSLVIEPWLSFAGHTQNSRIFHSMTVPAIVDAVLGGYGSGRLAPAWRWDLADPAVYAERSMCIQYRESDLAFVERLLCEEGIVYWFEHEAALDGALGAHTLVLADHSAAIASNLQPLVRYTQSSASMAEDSLVRFAGRKRIHTTTVSIASPDYRRADAMSSSSSSIDATLPLELQDVPGQYAYEDGTRGERLARRKMEALEAHAAQSVARGPWRSAQVATTFTLSDHPLHSGLDAVRDQFVIVSASHRARNNLSADVTAQLAQLLGTPLVADSVGTDSKNRELANDKDEPLFDTRLIVQPAVLPVRTAPLNAEGLPDVRLTPRPTVHGVQTAIVVGDSGPVHTDRDHRIKIRFHWQRDEAASTWVRVGESIAGANWGSNFIPRLGQEVLVAFVGGDIDRPVVVGSVYNGIGADNAQGNGVANGEAGATGNAAAWFPGSKASGKLQGHQHAHVLAGFKSQELASSGSGTGGCNQLVFDDSAQSSDQGGASSGGGRIELSTTQASTRLQLGKLLHQQDNQRLNPRGHGIDLATQAYGAVRAGSGVLISAWHDGNARQLDARPAQAVLDAAAQLTQTLTQSAQDHKAMLEAEPKVQGAKPGDVGKQLPVQLAQFDQHESLAATDSRGDPGDGSDETISGGAGTVSAWSRPELVLAAPAGIGAYTPAHQLWSAGTHISLNAGQDIQQLAQRHSSLVTKDGIVLYTYGRASNPSKPNQELGIRLHAASGNVNMQSQQAATHLTADKAVNMTSTHAMVQVTAPKHILLTAAGAAIRIQSGNITINGPGVVEFKASMKVLTGGASASAHLVSLRQPGRIETWIETSLRGYDGQPMSGIDYELTFLDGTKRSGTLDGSGQEREESVPLGTTTVIYKNKPAQDIARTTSIAEWVSLTEALIAEEEAQFAANARPSAQQEEPI